MIFTHLLIIIIIFGQCAVLPYRYNIPNLRKILVAYPCSTPRSTYGNTNGARIEQTDSVLCCVRARDCASLFVKAAAVVLTKRKKGKDEGRQKEREKRKGVYDWFDES